MISQTLLSLLLLSGLITVSAVDSASDIDNEKSHVCAFHDFYIDKYSTEMLFEHDLCFPREVCPEILECFCAKNDPDFTSDENSLIAGTFWNWCSLYTNAEYCDIEKYLGVKKHPLSYEYVIECAESLGIDIPDAQTPGRPLYVPSPPTQDHRVRNVGAGVLATAACVCAKYFAGRVRGARGADPVVRHGSIVPLVTGMTGETELTEIQSPSDERHPRDFTSGDV
jgi:hypothetical protein